MATEFTIVIDCVDPERLVRFWSEALGYVVEPAPGGFATWREYWRSRGLPEEELPEGEDSLVDPAGRGPPIWFQKLGTEKAGKNRLHFDLHVSGAATQPLAVRKQRVDAAAARLRSLGAIDLGPVPLGPGFDHYAVAMRDPEGNEFDVN